MKDILITAYASCFGLQFKILRDFPNTVKAMLTSLSEISIELLHEKSLLYFQMVKNLPNAMLADVGMCKDFLPLNFLHKFNSSEGKLKKVSEKLWDHYAEAVGGDT